MRFLSKVAILYVRKRRSFCLKRTNSCRKISKNLTICNILCRKISKIMTNRYDLCRKIRKNSFLLKMFWHFFLSFYFYLTTGDVVFLQKRSYHEEIGKYVHLVSKCIQLESSVTSSILFSSYDLLFSTFSFFSTFLCLQRCNVGLRSLALLKWSHLRYFLSFIIMQISDVFINIHNIFVFFVGGMLISTRQGISNPTWTKKKKNTLIGKKVLRVDLSFSCEHCKT